MLAKGQATDNSKTLEEMVRQLEQELEEENAFLLPVSCSLSSSSSAAENSTAAEAAEEIDEKQQRVASTSVASPEDETSEEMVERVERELGEEFKYKTATPATPAAGTAASTVPTTAAVLTTMPAETKNIELIPIGKVVPTATAVNRVAPAEPAAGPTGTPSTLLPTEAPSKMPPEPTTHCKTWMLINLVREQPN